jgi:hypothetical protein
MRKTQMTTKEIEKEKQNRLAFIDFLQGLLNLNPIERWSPQQAKKHPFITGEKFIFPFQPPFIPRNHHPQQQKPADSPILSSNKSHGYNTNRDSFLNPAYSSLPNHYEHTPINNKRSSYIPPLPSVLEPPHHLYNDTTTTTTTLDMRYPMQQQQQQQQQQMHIQQQQQQQGLTIPQNGRPRASTLGTMQVPPQIQWAAVDHMDGTTPAEGSLYSPYYPYGQQQQFNNSNGYSSMDDSKDNNMLLPRWGNSIDLERDGDWKEDNNNNSNAPISILPLTNTQSAPQHHHHIQHHRRSNSSIRFSDIPTTLSAFTSIGHHQQQQRSSVASLHRLMRGHAMPYSRQDLEWDGVVHQPTIPIQPPAVPSARIDNNQNDLNDNTDQYQKGWLFA